MSRPFLKDEVQMANKYRKRMFGILNPQGHASRNRTDPDPTPVRMAVIKSRK